MRTLEKVVNTIKKMRGSLKRSLKLKKLEYSVQSLGARKQKRVIST